MDIDKRILKGCIDNERRAQFELYRQCYGILMSVCLRYKRNHQDAESLLNMGFLKIVTNLKKYQQNVPFEAWIKRIMINTIIDDFRKYKKDKENLEITDFSDFPPSATTERNSADLMFEAEQLEAMIRALPSVSQKVFNLYAIDGYSHKEIAEMLSISVGTSKWHVSSARKQLREMIEQAKLKKDHNTISA